MTDRDRPTVNVVADTAAAHPVHNASSRSSATETRASSTSTKAASTHTITSQGKVTSGPSSSLASPLSSRDSSPQRLSHRPRVATALNSSRHNSHDPSPQRPPSLPGTTTSVPSAAAIQRALAAANITPQLQPTTTTDIASKLPRPAALRAAGATNGGEDTSPGHRPASPRIETSSQASSRRNSLRDNAPVTPNIVIQSSTPTSAHDHSTPSQTSTNSMPPPATRPGPRERGQTSLATVEEGSVPSTPSEELNESQSLNRTRTAERTPAATGAKNADLTSSEMSKRSDSGSDSAGKGKDKAKSMKSSETSDAAPARKPLLQRSSYTSLSSIKPKSSAESATRKMTVETETVSSVANPALGGGLHDRTAIGRAADGSSLRLRPSNETIKPKKERKKTRKPAAVTASNRLEAASKADIFEAKVVNAVNEADNSSDSDETFVYESNPPDHQPRRSRHPSRTPSTTSMSSIAAEARGLRSFGQVMNERAVAGKRSMKFANNPYNSSGADDDTLIMPNGAIRGGTLRPGGAVHHHQLSRHNRGGLGPQAVLADDDGNLYGHARRSSNSRHGSRPASPRVANGRTFGFANGTGQSRKNETYQYDLDADGADDERMPLIGYTAMRTPRGGRGIPSNVRLRHMDRAEESSGFWFRRMLGCAVMLVMVLMVILGAVGFFFITTKPLYDVRVREISNVLASEQEIMLDVVVEAINSNLMTISIDNMDVNVFVKSKYVGSEKWWRDHGMPPPPAEDDRKKDLGTGGDHAHRHPHTSTNLDLDWPSPFPDDDEDEQPLADPQMMLLGQVLHFDNTLTFEGSPIQREMRHATGELRIAHPGNRTEAGGTERWEKVLKHDFEIIVRGVLKYSLPLSRHVNAVPIDAQIKVRPDGENGIGRLPRVDGVVANTPNKQEGNSALLLSAKFRALTN